MNELKFNNINTGDVLPELSKSAINRTTLALFAGASNDHNPIHIDIDFARQAGLDDVFAHGMLVMAYLGQLLTNWAPQQCLISFGVRFGAITYIGDELTCRGKVIEKFEQEGEKRLRVEVQVSNQDDEVKLTGHAVIAVDE